MLSSGIEATGSYEQIQQLDIVPCSSIVTFVNWRFGVFSLII